MRLCAEDAAALRILCPTGVPDGLAARVVDEYARLQTFPIGFNSVWAVVRDAGVSVTVDWDRLPRGIRIEVWTGTNDPNLHAKTKEWRGGVYRGGVQHGTIEAILDGDSFSTEVRRRNARLPGRPFVSEAEDQPPKPVCTVVVEEPQTAGELATDTVASPTEPRAINLVPWLPRACENGDTVWVRLREGDEPKAAMYVKATPSRVVVEYLGELHRLPFEQVLMSQVVTPVPT